MCIRDRNITKPVYSNGRFVGLAVAALDLEQIAAQVLKGLATDAYQIGIFGRNGEVIFSSGKSVPLHNLSIEERTHRSFTFSNAEYYGYVRPLAVTDWSVGVFSRTVDRKTVLVQLFIRNVFVWLATFLAAIVIGFLASISVVRAVEKLTRQMTAARILPDKSEKIKSPRELVQLQRTYGRMQERLLTAQTRLKELNSSLEAKVKAQVETIQRHEALLTSLFSDMNEGIVLFNQKLEMRFRNPSAVRLLNLSENEARKRFLALVKEMHQSPDKHLFIHSGVYDLELRMFESGTKDVFCVIARDATSEVQIDRLKDELIGIAAHELKTPRMAAECLVKTVQDPESKETAAELLESADEMKDMISRWLDVAKLQTGSYEIHPEFCLIKPMIRKALKHFSGFKDFECSLEISPDAAAANVDKQAFMQIIQNLLSNAYKYRKEGSACRVKIQTRKLGDFLELMVEDDGIGVPESALDKIFDRFYQVRMDSARKIGGTGLGLYITKELVLLHKGKVTVASTLGEGTVFTLELPALPTETANEEEE